MDKAFKFLGGFLFGSILGASLALLLTPASGENLRMQMSDGFNQMLHDVKQAARDRRFEMEQQLEELRKPQS
jgi:gas vesicle protein